MVGRGGFIPFVQGETYYTAKWEERQHEDVLAAYKRRTCLVNDTTGMLGHVSQIKTQRITLYLYCSQLRHNKENTYMSVFIYKFSPPTIIYSH